MQRIEITGNLGHDPELRFTPNGHAVANLAVAHTDRRRDGDQWVDGDTTWFRVTVWRERAEQAAEHLRKGDRVHVVGKVSARAYKGSDGEPKASLEVDALELFKALPRAAATADPQQQRRQEPDQWTGEPPF